ncbi:MAG: glucose-1-phosphate adenylyltransferase subunit GlgD [Clostridia bacterium]|nr:glucose-1-phosphate adenylyltransferase subunit GlgD [Clostridia bacterium]
MKDVMGLIYTGENDIHLGELTSVRAVAALPIAGRYRVIDFQLSSMVHSGIKRVGVITQKNYQSLMDHLGSGREWDLHGKVGLQILPPFVTRDNQGMYDGLLDSLKSNLNFLRLSPEKYIVLTNSHSIYNMDYTPAIEQHIATGADITVLYAQPSEAFDGEGFEGEADAHFTVDEETKVIKAMEVGQSHPTCACPSLKIYVAEREKLLKIVEQSAANGYHHFGRDLIQRSINNGSLKICGYEYNGYCCQIDSIQAYFNFNMTVQSPKVREKLFPVDRPIYTKVRDDLPARYMGGQCSNSLVANGCVIEGTVINSVLFRGVKVAKGAVIKNSIIMQDAQIQEGAEIDHCILDKQSVIRRNGRLIAPAAYPIVIAKNVVI